LSLTPARGSGSIPMPLVQAKLDAGHGTAWRVNFSVKDVRSLRAPHTFSEIGAHGREKK